MSELLGLVAPPKDASEPTDASMPKSAAMHAKLVKADYHGSLMTGMSFAIRLLVLLTSG